MPVAVLFDVPNTLAKEPKDVSQYWVEAIRNLWGLDIEGIKISDYDGMTTQETAVTILKKNGVGDGDIKDKMPQFLEELPYSHYNVAGHDAIILVDGAREILNSMKGRACIATGMLERIAKNMFERGSIQIDQFIKFGVYGNAAFDMKGILGQAAGRARQELSADSFVVVSSAPQAISAAKALGMGAVGITSGKFSADELRSAGAVSIIKNLKDVQKSVR